MCRRKRVLFRVVWLGLLALGIGLAGCAPAATPPPEATPVPPGVSRPSGPVLTWERQGGIAGFCDELSVYADGRLEGRSCKGPLEQTGMLAAGQRAQLQAWLAELVPFEFVQSDEAVADAMTVRVAFVGQGDAEPTMNQRQEVEDLAARVYAELMPVAGRTPTPEVSNPVPGDIRATDAARDALARELGVGAEAIGVVEVTAREWPDSCLGLAGPDEMCLQVITPGFQVLLQAGGREYVLRTNQDGTVVRLAGSGQSLAPGTVEEGADTR